MASLIRVPVHADERGILSVVDGILPFPVRRVYAIRGVPRGAVRGGHRHRRNRQALLCLAGRCEVTVRNRGGEEVFALASAAEALLLEAADWHRIANFSADAILLVLASEGYDPDDYEPEPEP